MTEPNLNKKINAKPARRNTQNDCHQWLSDSSRVHQIRFRPGLRPRPRWGSLRRFPRHPSNSLDPHSQLGLGRNLCTYNVSEDLWYIVYGHNRESKRSFMSIKMLVFGLRPIRYIPCYQRHSQSKIHPRPHCEGLRSSPHSSRLGRGNPTFAPVLAIVLGQKYTFAPDFSDLRIYCVD